MNKIIRKLLVAAGVMLLPALAQTSLATHIQGSELMYSCVAPNVYTVNCKVYRDCTGQLAPTAITLDLKSQGCNAGRSINVPMSGSPRVGNPYCQQIPVTCSSSGKPNFEADYYSTTVTFSAAEQACPNWIFSTTNNSRPEIANIVNPQGNIHSEAYLYLSSIVNNNSPEFGGLTIPNLYINYGKPIMLSSYTVEIDGDSLVYSLKDPFSASGTAYTYATYQPEMLYDPNSTKSVLAPGGTYSATYPIHSYAVDWTQPTLTPVKTFVFDPQTGSIAFTPTRFRPNAPAVDGENKYAMVVQVDEYRKVKGVTTKIGSISRDMLITVSDGGTNENPTITSAVANGQPILPSDIITVRPGTTLTFKFSTADLNPNDLMTLTSDGGGYKLNGASVKIYQNGGNQVYGTITWGPMVQYVMDQIYYFHIFLMDNACPLKGHNTYTYGVRFSNTGAVTGMKQEVSDAGFIAYPNPFSQDVSFKLNLKNAEQTIIVYNALGQEVDRVSLAGKSNGEQSIRWENASRFAAGVYVAKLINQGNTVQTLKFSKLQ